MHLKIRKGDKVVVLSGASKGKQGKVLGISKKNMTVTVEGVNLQKHHEKAKANQPAGIITKEGPIHYSNVMLLDKKGEPSRVGFRYEGKDGKTKKVRFFKSTGEVV